MKIGDRVKISDKGRRMGIRPNRLYILGTVVGFSRTANCIGVRWDGSKGRESLHRSFLELVQEELNHD